MAEISAAAVKKLRDDPERFLATVQILMTIIGTAAGALGGAAIEHPIAMKMEEAGVPYGQHLGVVIVIALISFIELVLGELVPKSLALRYSDSFSFRVGRPLLGLSHLMRPLVWFVTRCSNLLLSLFGDKTTFTEARL